MHQDKDRRDKDLEALRKNLPWYRQKLGERLGRSLSQQDIADLSGVAVFSISRYERGIGLPDRHNLQDLAEVYGVHTDDLFADDPPPPTPKKLVAVRVEFFGPEPDEPLKALVEEFTAQLNSRQIGRLKGVKQTIDIKSRGSRDGDDLSRKRAGRRPK